MAMFVRNQEDLLAIRCKVEITKARPQLVVDLFRGAEQLRAPERIPLVDLGLRMADLNAETGRYPVLDPQVPAALEAVFADAAALAEMEPVWLQLAYGAEMLGAYPWEQMFSDQLDRLLLRVPNFARDTYRRDDPRPIAICAAAPRAKGAPDWRPQAHHLLQGLDRAGPRQIVFFDSNEGHGMGLHDTQAVADSYPNLTIRIAPLPEYSHAPDRVRGVTPQGEIRNPWLTWMRDVLGPDGAHGVHILCPGYASNGHGALALPQTPLYDNDSSWSRFVSADELSGFLDALDVQITGLTAVGDPIWHTGLRMLANELSWLRPGPILMTTGQIDWVPERAYRALLNREDIGNEPATDMFMSVHPRTIAAATQAQAYTMLARGVRAEESTDDRVLDIFSSIEQAPLPKALTRKIDAYSSVRPKSSVQEARDLGALRAMEFISKLKSGEADK